MVTRETKIGSVFGLFTLAAVLSLGTAQADVESLYVGGTYTGSIVMNTVAANGTVLATQNLAGGSIDVSSLNGVQLAYLYCVDIPDEVYVNETYSSTFVDNYGLVNNSPDQFNGPNTGTQVRLPALVVDEVAWLLDNYGVGGQGDAAVALQAAIWHAVYSDNSFNATYSLSGSPVPASFDLSSTGNSAGAVTDYDNEIAALNIAVQTNAVASAAPILWLSPAPPQSSIDQGLVTANVPEPTSTVFLGVFFLAGLLGFAAKNKLTEKLAVRQ